MSDEASVARSPLLRHPVLVAFAVLLLFALLRLIATAADVLLLGFLAVLLATLLTYPIDFLSRWMPRTVALILTILLVLAVAVGVVVAAVPIVAAQVTRFFDQVPVALHRLSELWASLQRQGSVPPIGGPTIGARLEAEAESLLYKAVPFAVGAGSALVTMFVLFVIALFLAYAPGSYREGLKRLVPREHEGSVDAAWIRVGATLRHWTGGIAITMLVTGVLSAFGLLIAGIDGWLFLGVLTFLGTFVPYVGAIASAVPALLVGLAQSPTKFLYVLVVYVVVHLVEGYVVGPFVMRRAVRIRPGLLVFWQLLVAAVFGLPGIIVATPLLACLEVLIGYFYVEQRLGKPPAEG